LLRTIKVNVVDWQLFEAYLQMFCINIIFLCATEILKLNGWFWTSGTSEGLLSGDHPGWCATRQFAQDVHWPEPDKRPLSLLQSRYLALSIREEPGDSGDFITDTLPESELSILCEKN
jgi:hypothetical protein